MARHHLNRDLREIRDALALAQPAALLQVGHDDVDRADLEHLAKAVG